MARNFSQDEIYGNRLVLRPFTETCITGQYLSWLNDRQLMQYSRQRHRVHTKESSLAYLSSFAGTPNFFWSVFTVAANNQIGTLTAYLEINSQVADIGILIGDASARGIGLGKESWGMAMAYLFDVVGVRKITGGSVADNLAMIHIFEGWQMRLEAVLKAQELLADIPTDVKRYGILRSEWDTVASKSIIRVKSIADVAG